MSGGGGTAQDDDPLARQTGGTAQADDPEARQTDGAVREDNLKAALADEAAAEVKVEPLGDRQEAGGPKAL